MILIIALKEWRTLWRRPLLVRFAVLVFLLYVASLLAGVWSARAAAARAEGLQNQFINQWLEQGSKLPHAAAHFGMPWVASPPLMTAFEPGIWPWVGEFTYSGAHDMVRFRSAPMASAGSMSALWPVSPVWVLQYVLPLWVVLVAYRLSLDERAWGTERALRALGVHPLVQLLGRGLGVCGALLVVLVACALSASAALAPFGGLTADHALIIFIQCGLAFLGAGVLAWIALAVPLLIPQPRPAAGVTLGAWFLLCAAVPAWTNDRARLERLGPSEIEMARVLVHDMERGAYEFGGRDQRAETTLQTLLTSLGAGRKVDLPLNFPLFFLMAEDETFNIYVDRRLDAALQIQRAQDAWRRRWASASPFTAWQVISPVLTGTGFVDRVKLANALEVHRRRYIRIMNRQQAASLLRDQEAVSDRALWSTIVPFRSDPPAPLNELPAYQREFFLMSIWFVGAAAIAACTSAWAAFRETV